MKNTKSIVLLHSNTLLMTHLMSEAEKLPPIVFHDPEKLEDSIFHHHIEPDRDIEIKVLGVKSFNALDAKLDDMMRELERPSPSNEFLIKCPRHLTPEGREEFELSVSPNNIKNPQPSPFVANALGHFNGKRKSR